MGPITKYYHYHHINDINCTGNESNIQQCPSNNLTNYRCKNYNAGVFCNSECKLYIGGGTLGGPTNFTNFTNFEINYNNN